MIIRFFSVFKFKSLIFHFHAKTGKRLSAFGLVIVDSEWLQRRDSCCSEKPSLCVFAYSKSPISIHTGPSISKHSFADDPLFKKKHAPRTMPCVYCCQNLSHAGNQHGRAILISGGCCFNADSNIWLANDERGRRKREQAALMCLSQLWLISSVTLWPKTQRAKIGRGGRRTASWRRKEFSFVFFLGGGQLT